MGQVVTDMGAVISAPLMVIGEKLGLYKAMAGAGPLTSAELAERTGVAERSVREWLRNQAAGGYLTYDAESDTLHAPGRARAGARRRGEPVSTCSVPSSSVASLYADEEQITRGVPDGQGHGLARARPPPLPRHRAVLPARLQGASRRRMDPGARWREREARARREGRGRRLRARRVDDHHGAGVSRTRRSSASTTTTARSSKRASGRRGRRRRPDHLRGRLGEGLPRQATTTSSACSTACTTWATRSAPPTHVRETLADDGTWMIVEPFANDRVEDNLNPVGRVFYGASTVDLHASVALAGSGARARRPGRRGTACRGDQGRRLQPRPARDRDAVQPDPRSDHIDPSPHDH